MTHRGGNGFDSGESPSRDAAVRGFDSRPLHTRSLFNCESSCEAVAEAIPPRLRGHGGAISEEDSMIIGVIIIGIVFGTLCFLVTAIGQGWL